MRMRSLRRCTLLLLLALVLPACSSNTAQQPAPGSSRDPSEAMKELAEVYKYRAIEKIPVPTKLDDLAEQQNSLDTAWPLIQDGTIVVIWRAGYAANGTEILAYEKTAPSQGGTVLLRNGTVKQVSADEFKSMPRAR